MVQCERNKPERAIHHRYTHTCCGRSRSEAPPLHPSLRSSKAIAASHPFCIVPTRLEAFPIRPYYGAYRQARTRPSVHSVVREREREREREKHDGAKANRNGPKRNQQVLVLVRGGSFFFRFRKSHGIRCGWRKSENCPTARRRPQRKQQPAATIQTTLCNQGKSSSSSSNNNNKGETNKQKTKAKQSNRQQ